MENTNQNNQNNDKYKPPMAGTFQKKVYKEPVNFKNASTQTYKRDVVTSEKYGKCEFWNRENKNRDGSSWRK